MGGAQSCGNDGSCCGNQKELGLRSAEADLAVTPGQTIINSFNTPQNKLQGTVGLTTNIAIGNNAATSTHTKLASQNTSSPREEFKLDRNSSRSRTLGEGKAVNQEMVIVEEAQSTPREVLADLMEANKIASEKVKLSTGHSPAQPTSEESFSKHKLMVEFQDYFGIDSPRSVARTNRFPMLGDFQRAINPRKLAVLKEAGGFEFKLEEFPGKDNDIYFLQSHDNNVLYYGQGRCKTDLPIHTGDKDLISQISKEGQGYYWIRNSILFVGYFFNDLPQGPGILIYRDDSYFMGVWTKGKLNGYGIFQSVEAKVYRGYWKDNLQDGEGEEIWLATGTTYSGAFVEGKRHGQGTLFLAEEGAVYKGTFHDNKFCGHGTYKWASGDVYTGMWIDDKMHGKGLFSWADGRSYSGEYVNGFKDGYGVFKWNDGRKYEGLWKKGHPYGQGTYTDSSGTKSSGVFGEGQLSISKLSGKPPRIPKPG